MKFFSFLFFFSLQCLVLSNIHAAKSGCLLNDPLQRTSDSTNNQPSLEKKSDSIFIDIKTDTSHPKPKVIKKSSPVDSIKIPDVDTSYSRITKKNTAVADSVVQKTTYYFYYKPFQSKIEETYHPIFDLTDRHRFDKLFHFGNGYYAYRHGIGQPHRQLHFNLPFLTSYEYQTNPFSAYIFTQENIKFFQTTYPYTQLEFSNSFLSDYQLNVIHSQNILPNWNAGIEYNHIKSNGEYSNSSVLNHQISGTTNFFSKDLRYELFSGVIWNNYRVGESGGIVNDSLFTENLQTTRSGIPINQPNANTHYKDLQFLLSQSFRFHKMDSLFTSGSIINPGKITHALHYQKEVRIYYDSLGILNYAHTYFDSIITHDSIRSIQLRNTVFWTNDIFQDALYLNPVKLYFGVHYDHIRNQNSEILHDTTFIRSILHDTTFMQTTLTGRAKISVNKMAVLSPFLEYVAFGSYSKGDYGFKTDLDINLSNLPIPVKPWFEVALAARKPDYIFARYASNHYQWDMDVTQTKTFKANAAFRFSKIDLGVAFFSIQNLYYLNEEVMPVSDSSTIKLLQLNVNGNFSFWDLFHWKSVNVIQSSSKKEILAVPLFYAKHSLYFDFLMFKKNLRIQTGVDLYLNTSYYPDSYSPDLASFYIQREKRLGEYVWGDFFISAQISRAIMFLKFTHLTSVFSTKYDYFMIPHYPTNDMLVKWGFSWKFFD